MSQEEHQEPKRKYNPLIMMGIIVIIVIAIIGIYIIKKGNVGEESQEEEEISQSSVKSVSNVIKEFKLNYTDKDPSIIKNIGMFEAQENWRGDDSVIDRSSFIEGKSSLNLISNNRKLSIVYLDKKIDLKGVKFIEFMVKSNSLHSLESAFIKLGDEKMENYWAYSFVNLISKENKWEVISAPLAQFVANKKENKIDLAQIAKIQIEIVSRPEEIVMVNFDSLKAYRDDAYLDDWEQNIDNFLGLYKKEEKIYLQARGAIGSIAIIKQTKGAENFEYSATIIPQKKGKSGLVFRSNKSGLGYHFLIGGAESNEWLLTKNVVKKGAENLAKGTLSNLTFSSNEKYWLKVKTKGDKLKGFISTDGNEYTELFSVHDSEYRMGGVGIMASATDSLISDIEFKKN